MKRFERKNIIVTGGAGGLGKTIALEFAREGASNVAIVDRETADETVAEVEALGAKAIAVRCDIADEANVVEMSKEVAEALEGKIDVLVNNAGFNGKANLVKDMKLSDWEYTLRVNLTGTMIVCREFAPYMIGRKEGKILNVSSNVGRRGLPLRSDYVCSKWAVLGLTQTLALELVEHGIRVNAVCPGPIEGERIEQLVRMHADAEGVDFNEMHKAWENVPMQRFARPEEVSNVIKFLCSDDSSAMTGQALNVTCGFIMT